MAALAPTSLLWFRVRAYNVKKSNVLLVQTYLPKVRSMLLLLMSLAHLGIYLRISRILSLLALIHLNW